MLVVPAGVREERGHRTSSTPAIALPRHTSLLQAEYRLHWEPFFACSAVIARKLAMHHPQLLEYDISAHEAVR